VESSPDAVSQYLKRCGESHEPVTGSFVFRDKDREQHAYCCQGAAVHDQLPSQDRSVVLRLIAEESPQSSIAPSRGEYEQKRFAAGLHGHQESLRRSEEDLRLVLAAFRQRLEQLAQAEVHVRAVVENAVDGIVTINELGTILTVNPAAEWIFGYKAEELVGQNVKVLMPEPFVNEHDRYLANYLQTGQAKILGIGREVLGKRKDGSTFPMDLAVSEFYEQEKRCFTGIVRDITQRKRSENTIRFLADASRSLAALVDYQSTMQLIVRLAVPFFEDWCIVHMPDDGGELKQLATAHVDPARTVLAEEIGTRYPPRLIAHIGILPVFRTGQSELVPEVTDAMVAELAQDEEHLGILRQFAPKSLLRVALEAHGTNLGVMSFISSTSGRKYDAKDLAVAEDLARRAAIAIENARLYGQLRQADRRKDEFLAMLAHELRNPLAPLRSGLDFLAVSGVEQEMVAIMEQQVEHLVRLVDDLLDVSRIMRGKIELRREAVELVSVVQRAVQSVRPLLDAHKHQLTISLPSVPIDLEADPVRLAQIVINLLNNAAKYTDQGGQIHLSVWQEQDQAMLSVRDTGIGISKELLPRVFDLFTQADHSLQRSQGGLGIGLTLVRNLIEMHGGSVTVRSEGEGKGSEFTVRVPIRAKPKEQRPQAGRSTSEFCRRILIVEDNAGSAWILARLLAKLGDHEIQMAHDGLSAFDIAQDQHPEIILLDIGLPEMNGYEVATRLRQQPEFSRTLLVAMTGYGTEEDRRRSAEAGFDKHLVKPISLDQLREILADPKLIGV
jgi:PAS domain S-box-containing protein